MGGSLSPAKNEALSAELDEIIVQQANMRVFFNGSSPYHSESVIQVRFNEGQQQQQQPYFDEEHVIMLHLGFPPPLGAKRPELYCLFPNTNNPRKRILAAHKYWFLSSLNADLNDALRDSMEQGSHGGTTRFALAFGKHVVGFGAVQGTLYLVWARSVTFYNANHTVVRFAYDCPLLVNMNGEALITGIYMVEMEREVHKAVLPMVQREHVRTPTLVGDYSELWVREKRPDMPGSEAAVRVMGYDDAVNYATRPSRNTHDWVMDATPMAVVGGMVVTDDDAASATDGGYDWYATPQGLFAAESKGLAIHPQFRTAVTTATGIGAEFEPRDPFREYTE